MSTHQQWDIVSGVGVTALAVALARAIETNRPDAIVHDPYAEHFLRAVELPDRFAAWPGVDTLGDLAEIGSWWESMPAYMASRTRFFDEFFLSAADAGIRQVVIVASGLDTRPFRLDWPDGTDVYEVDQAMVLKFKDEVLDGRGVRPRCTRHTVPADLRDDWGAELRAAGFDPLRPTVWLAEGLLPYLTPAAEDALFATIRRLSAPGSRLAVEAIGGSVRYMAVRTPVATAWESEVGLRVAELWQTESRPEPVDVLQDAGWTVDIERVAEAGRRHGRHVRGIMSPFAEYAMLLDCRL